MMRVMLLGDTHGDLKFMTEHVIPAAVEAKADCILQVGDFGYYEHYEDIKYEIDTLSCELEAVGIPMTSIQGNHDKISYLMEHYGRNVADWGFIQYRKMLYFIPNGTRWEWQGYKFIALGGAYSIDKPGRLKIERMEGSPPGTEWFPEEEMTDEELDHYIFDRTPVHVMITHDAPSSVNIPMDLQPVLECEPNRQRLQRAVRTLKPKTLVHGHFHLRYETEARSGDNGEYTRVIGLGANVPRTWRTSFEPTDAWAFMDLYRSILV